MKHYFLLPYGFKWAGWVLLLSSLLLGGWIVAMDFDPQSSELLSSLQLEGTLINNYAVIGLWLGAIFVGCSKERVEDEMITRIRLNALMIGFYLQAIFIIIASFVCNSLDYLEVMLYNLVTYPLIFVVIYRWMLRSALRGMSDEE